MHILIWWGLSFSDPSQLIDAFRLNYWPYLPWHSCLISLMSWYYGACCRNKKKREKDLAQAWTAGFFDQIHARNFKLNCWQRSHQPQSPIGETFHFSSLCGHVPCVILLKGSKSQSPVQWLMCLTLHEISFYSEVHMSSFSQGCSLYCLPSTPASLREWLSQK